MARKVPRTGSAEPATKARYDRKYRYGMAIEDFEALLVAQGGLCAICRQPETVSLKGREPQLCVDHQHGEKRVRGLLCRSCNSGLGLFQDSPEVLIAAFQYLVGGQ